MYGQTMGELKVITVDIRRVKMVWTRQGSQGNQWKEARITLESTLPYQVYDIYSSNYMPFRQYLAVQCVVPAAETSLQRSCTNPYAKLF